jgi:hypothetical protein
VFENRMLRRIFGPMGEEVTGSWRKQHNEELHNLYSSSNIAGNIKLRRLGLAGHVSLVERRGMRIGFWRESHKVRDH